MPKKTLLIALTIIIFTTVTFAINGPQAQVFVGQDMHLAGRSVLSYQLDASEHSLVFQDGFSMSVGTNHFRSKNAVVWLDVVETEYHGRRRVDYNVKAYLSGDISVEKAKKVGTVLLDETVVEGSQDMVVKFTISGEVFVTADKREFADPRELSLYKQAKSVAVEEGPLFVVQPGALVPELPIEKTVPQKVWATKGPVDETAVIAKLAEKKGPMTAEKAARAAEQVGTAESAEPETFEEVDKAATVLAKLEEETTAEKAEKEPKFIYPINIAPAGEVEPKIESAKADDGSSIATITGRFYIWQKKDEGGIILELHADNAVVFYSSQDTSDDSDTENVLAKGAVRAIYMSGDVIMTEGQRTIRADEVYYDFQQQKTLVVNAEMRNFDVKRGIPVYVRAKRLRQVAENKFFAENVVITSSEFYLPQISATASSVVITDTTTIDQQEGKVTDKSYDAQMYDVQMKYKKTTFFAWPFMRSNMQRPDVPIKKLSVSHDSTWGTAIETQWYLSRLLGLKEPEGVETTLAMDYYSKRGFGIGAEIDYKKENYFGNIKGYVIRDTGEDDLGRSANRRNLDSKEDIRGRFSWQHRQFLPNNWQLTTGIGYVSDENFMESFYRNEFNTFNKPETYVHLKRLQDNWAVAVLAKARINDFEDTLEELPTVEHHLTGKSIFDDKFTLYSDSQISRFRQRIGNNHNILMDEDHYTFISHRTEIDMPFQAGQYKVVPFLAGTYGFDDRSGFRRTLVDGTNTGRFGTEQVLVGEAGIRVATQYSKIYPNVNSRLWNLNQLRHIVKPHLMAVFFSETDGVVEQRDVVSVGLSQRLQTKRGEGDKQRVVDWMELNVDFTWVDKGGRATAGADKLIWNRSMIPLRVSSAPEIFNGDFVNNLRRFEMYGPQRDSIDADYTWRISDTTALLADMNYDMQSGVVQQFNIGFSRFCWPNLSYYIGSRYLRRTNILGEKGSNAVTFAATYILDPRYSFVFSQQYDFDYGKKVRSEITLIRRYHRMSCSFTYSADESLKEQMIVFSIWPQGVPEMALGKRSHTDLGGTAGY